MNSKKPDIRQQTKERLRSAMNAGFSLSGIVKNCGLSAYRVSIILNDIADGRVHGGDFSDEEVATINKHLDVIKKDLGISVASGFFEPLNLALQVGVKGSTIAHGADVTVGRVYNYISKVNAGKPEDVVFNDAERCKIIDHLKGVVGQI